MAITEYIKVEPNTVAGQASGDMDSSLTPVVSAVSDDTTSSVRLLYKKSRLSGYVDNAYTFSLTTSQFQQNNIRNFGVAASIGVAARAVSVAVSGGYSSESDSMKKGNTSVRKVYMTGSFNVPKIEISLDISRPCASDEFVAAVNDALTSDNDSTRVANLLNTLGTFGQFIATRYVLGGKLITTETKELTTEETADSLMEKFAWKVKAKVSAEVAPWAASAHVEASASREGLDRDQNATDDQKETQVAVMNAIGGEGILVSDTAKWAISLGRYHTWSIIEMTDLVPSIDLLPHALRKKCNDLLEDWIRTRDMEDMLSPKKFFLLCDGYYDRYHTRPYYCIKSDETLQAITLEDADMYNGMSLAMEECNLEISRQHWYFTGEGYILHKKKMGTAEFALTYNSTTQTIEAAVKGSADNQFWELLPSQQLYNISTGKYLALEGGKFVMKDKGNGKNLIWKITMANSDRANKFYSFEFGKTGEVLTIGDSSRHPLRQINDGDDRFPILSKQFINAECQLWEYRDNKLLVSKLRDSSGENLYLRALDDSGHVVAVKKPEAYDKTFYWHINDEGNLYAHSDATRILGKTPLIREDFGMIKSSVATRKKHRWQMKEVVADASPQEPTQAPQSAQAPLPMEVRRSGFEDGANSILEQGKMRRIYVGKREFPVPITGFKWNVALNDSFVDIHLNLKLKGAGWVAVGDRQLYQNISGKVGRNHQLLKGALLSPITIAADHSIVGAELKEDGGYIWLSLKVKDKKSGKELWLNTDKPDSIPVAVDRFPTKAVEVNSGEAVAGVEFDKEMLCGIKILVMQSNNA